MVGRRWYFFPALMTLAISLKVAGKKAVVKACLVIVLWPVVSQDVS